MIPWAGESPRALPDTQDSASIPWHLYRIHPACFAACAFSQEDLADIKVFRESISRLPKDEILKIVTGIQMVRYHVPCSSCAMVLTYPNSNNVSASTPAR